jgi:NADH dehydrogenase FAD-containing subunit
MFVREQGEGNFIHMISRCDPFNTVTLWSVAFGLLVWSTGLAANPLVQSISEVAKDEKTGKYVIMDWSL